MTDSAIERDNLSVAERTALEAAGKNFYRQSPIPPSRISFNAGWLAAREFYSEQMGGVRRATKSSPCLVINGGEQAVPLTDEQAKNIISVLSAAYPQRDEREEAQPG